MKVRTRSAFTAVELLGVLALIGILAAVAVPIMHNFREAALDRSAMAQAAALNSAMLSYRDQFPDAQTKWNAAVDDTTRYALLTTNNLLPMAATTLAAYQGNGYTFTFTTGTDSLLKPVSLKKGGIVLNYTTIK